MPRKWILKLYMHLFGVLLVTLGNSYAFSANDQHDVSDSNSSKLIGSSVILYRNQDISLSRSDHIQNEPHDRYKRAVIQTPLKLIDEKHCPEIRNLCSNLCDGSDDLPVLECVQTFLSNQIDNLSDECQHTIWTHTANMMNYATVLQILQKPCQPILSSMSLQTTDEIGNVLGKLIDKKDEIKQPSCTNLISRLEAVAFGVVAYYLKYD